MSGTAAITGLTGATISSGSITLANPNSATEELGVISASIEMEFSSNSSADVSGWVILKEGTALSSVNKLVFEDLSATVGNATVSKVEITTTEGEGALSTSAATADATIEVEVAGTYHII